MTDHYKVVAHFQEQLKFQRQHEAFIRDNPRMKIPPLPYSATWKYTCGHTDTLGYGNNASMLADKERQESGKCWACRNKDMIANTED